MACPDWKAIATILTANDTRELAEPERDEITARVASRHMGKIEADRFAAIHDTCQESVR